MARLTPQVQQGTLTTFLPSGTQQTVALDDEIWMRWLTESNECCFRFHSPLEIFSVRCENSKYWHADCRYHGRNVKEYLGKTERVTMYALYEVARKLYESIHGEPPPTTLLELTQAEETAYREAAPLAREASFLLDTFQTPTPSDSSHASRAYDMTLVQRLTPREREVLLVLSYGLTNPQIAAPLDISVSAVKMHLRHIYYKLSIARRHDLIAYARQLKSSMSVMNGREGEE